MNSAVTKNKNFFYSLLQYFGFSLIILVFILFQIPGPISSFVEEDLGGHMVAEHSIFFLFGYFIVFSIEKLINKKSLFESKIFSYMSRIILF